MCRRPVAHSPCCVIQEAIPFKIMLSMLDEIFELQGNQWLRKRIMSLLRGIIKTALGDSINRKIVDYINSMMSVEQVAVYVGNFKQSMWPGGILAPAAPERTPVCTLA